MCSSPVELRLDWTHRSTEWSSSVVPHCTVNVDLEISPRFPLVKFSFKYETISNYTATLRANSGTALYVLANGTSMSPTFIHRKCLALRLPVNGVKPINTHCHTYMLYYRYSVGILMQHLVSFICLQSQSTKTNVLYWNLQLWTKFLCTNYLYIKRISLTAAVLMKQLFKTWPG